MSLKDFSHSPKPKGATHYTNHESAMYRWLKKEEENVYFYHEELHKWNKYPDNSWVLSDHLRHAEEVDSEDFYDPQIPTPTVAPSAVEYTLITFRKDWADEFECESFEVFEGSVEEATNYINKQFFEENPEDDDDIGDSIWFGTNEGWENDELDPKDFTFKSITITEADVITRLLGKSFGVGY